MLVYVHILNNYSVKMLLKLICIDTKYVNIKILYYTTRRISNIQSIIFDNRCSYFINNIII